MPEDLCGWSMRMNFKERNSNLEVQASGGNLKTISCPNQKRPAELFQSACSEGKDVKYCKTKTHFSYREKVTENIMPHFLFNHTPVREDFQNNDESWEAEDLTVKKELCEM